MTYSAEPPKELVWNVCPSPHYFKLEVMSRLSIWPRFLVTSRFFCFSDPSLPYTVAFILRLAASPSIIHSAGALLILAAFAHVRVIACTTRPAPDAKRIAISLRQAPAPRACPSAAISSTPIYNGSSNNSSIAPFVDSTGYGPTNSSYIVILKPATGPLVLPTLVRYEYEPAGGKGINLGHVEFEGRAEFGLTVPANDGDEDKNGHGTHSADIIGSHKYSVRLIAVKVLGSNECGTTADVIAGVVMLPPAPWRRQTRPASPSLALNHLLIVRRHRQVSYAQSSFHSKKELRICGGLSAPLL
ncbi:hypothetical protein K438DRAFT_1984552 [Mycena galopus ATCC 62051]|nr:hypothetical protein K438DRAFT_1984552 [Mycena galopus ATCC 62051]